VIFRIFLSRIHNKALVVKRCQIDTLGAHQPVRGGERDANGVIPKLFECQPLHLFSRRFDGQGRIETAFSQAVYHFPNRKILDRYSHARAFLFETPECLRQHFHCQRWRVA